MASFQVREDIENKHTNLNSKAISKNGRKRPALQILNAKNGDAAVTKKPKLALEIDNQKQQLQSNKQLGTNRKPTNEIESLKENVDRLKFDSGCSKQKSETSEREDLEEVENYIGTIKEYNKDIWKYLFSLESKVEWPKVNFMRKQPHINLNMREILIDWLVTVAQEYHLSEQTLHITIHYIDRFLSHMSVTKEKFQLLGSAAMMVAGKIQEIYPPTLQEWVFLCQDTYTVHHMIRMEQMLVKTLRFEFHVPTMFTFIEQISFDQNINDQTKYLAMYFCELVLLEGADYFTHVPSKLAAAALALARFTLNDKEPWPKSLKIAFGYSLRELSPVVEKQIQTFRDSPTKEHQAIQTKYKSPKYHKVALLKPKNLSMEHINA